jgi:ABC-type antimicrobial peptide transport system permease subunit
MLVRRELAVLRALGMSPGDVRASVVWQGLLVASSMLLIGVPLGLAVGSAVWRAVAAQLGMRPGLRPSAWLVTIVPLTALIAVFAATLPAGRARRLRVAEALRVE